MVTKLQSGKYYGTTEKRCDLGGLILAETAYPAGLFIPPHEHANPFFCVMLEGWSTQSCARRTWTNGPATVMAFPAGLGHANQWHESSGRVLHVEFAGSWLEALRGPATMLDRPLHYESGPTVWLAKRLIAEYRRQDDVSPLALQGLALELLADSLRARAEIPRSSPPRWLGRVRDLLRQRFAENLSLNEIAAAVGISADHLTRSFRTCEGCTLGDFVRRLRVEYACRQLAGSDDGLAKIALDAGFADQSHLTRTFKRQMRITPAAFRNLYRGRISCSKS